MANKIHYEASDCFGEISEDTTACGMPVPLDYQYSGFWAQVTCKKCLKAREKIESSLAGDMNAYTQQLGEMAEFMTQQGGTV